MIETVLRILLVLPALLAGTLLAASHLATKPVVYRINKQPSVVVLYDGRFVYAKRIPSTTRTIIETTDSVVRRHRLDPKQRAFILDSPRRGAAANWVDVTDETLALFAEFVSGYPAYRAPLGFWWVWL